MPRRPRRGRSQVINDERARTFDSAERVLVAASQIALLEVVASARAPPSAKFFVGQTAASTYSTRYNLVVHNPCSLSPLSTRTQAKLSRHITIPPTHTPSHIPHTSHYLSIITPPPSHSDAPMPVAAFEPHEPSGRCAGSAPFLYEKMEVPAPGGSVDMMSSATITLVNSL